MTDLVTEDELACPKCKLVGCDCDEQDASAASAPHKDVCPVCHRAFVDGKCLCKSHVELRPIAVSVDALPVTQKLSAQQIEARVNELMHHYYNRDPAGLARTARQMLGS